MTNIMNINASLECKDVTHHFMSTNIRKQLLLIKEISYILIEQIGKGHYGVVHSASNTLNNCIYAIKITKKRLQSNYDEIIMYKELVKDKNYSKYIAKLHHIFEINEHYYIVMDYINGCYFDNKFFNEKITTIEELIKLLKKIIKIVDYIHKKNLIINDMKPENLIITEDLNPTLIDVGLITSINNKEHYMKGTPMYFPPESFEKICSFQKKDIWMLGAILVKFIAKEYPLQDCIYESGLFYKFNINDLEKTLNTTKYLYFKKTLLKFGSSDSSLKKLSCLWIIIKKCFNINFEERPSISKLLKHKVFL